MSFALTLRQKFVIAFAALAAFVAALVGTIGYTVTEHGLRGEVDRSLTSAAATLASGGTVTSGTQPTGSRGGDPRTAGRDQGIVQAAQNVAADGTVTLLIGSAMAADVTDPALARQLLEATAGTQVLRTLQWDGQSYRVLYQARGIGNGYLQVARNLAETDHVLGDLALNAVWIGSGVLAAAAAAGWFAARQITRRLTALTAAAEQVRSTGVLDVGIATGGHDEVTRLGAAMQSMLADLARSRDDQQRLVQDAGHELRTPLTSLRTNVSVLRRFDELSIGSRGRLLDDVEGEARELTDLVNELVELATDRRDTELDELTDLGAIAERVGRLFRRRTGRQVTVDVDADLPLLRARPHSVERAVSNLVDNALKFDADGVGAVEITVRGATVTVADRGPGLAAGDVDRIFDRFYRSTAARSLPGSGLGLSIVQDVVMTHGGTVTARNRPGGGAVIGFTLGNPAVLPNSKLNTANS